MTFPIRTGVDILEVPDGGQVDTDLVRQIVSILQVLREEALASAARYCTAHGRRTVTAHDMVRALKYESRAFWDKDIEERFALHLQEERAHSYETDDDDSEAETDGASDTEEGEGEEQEEESVTGHTTEVSVADECFVMAVDRIEAEWASWTPNDPLKLILKRAIDATSAQFEMS